MLWSCICGLQPCEPRVSPWVRRRCVKGLPEADSGALDVEQMEFLANVDQPAEAKLWVQYYRAAQAQGQGEGQAAAQRWSFLAVIFRHDANENRAHSSMARMARGKLLALLQDDEGGPKECDWVTHVNAQVDARLRTVVVGLNLGAVKETGWSIWMDRGPFASDTVTGALVNFGLYADVGPMIVLRRFWIESGGFDDSWGPQGQCGIFSDWEYTSRAWAAGERVSARSVLCCCSQCQRGPLGPNACSLWVDPKPMHET